jgi:hypothetical protein
MLRQAVCAAVILVFSLSAARAEEFFAAIKKIEDGKITVLKFKGKFKKGEKPPSEKVTLTLAKDVKVLKTTKFNKEEKKFETEPLSGGLQNDIFKNLGERGVFVRIITNADGQVSEIRVFGGKGKRGKRPQPQ